MAEWLRVLDLKSGGPRFKSSTLPLNLICLFFWYSVVLSSTASLHLLNSQLVCIPPVGIFNNNIYFLFPLQYLSKVSNLQFPQLAQRF